jgi:ADP-dependent NAD(P)H-hydrate dehydratase / NAD(P)H-hydrate epimerase
MKIFNSQQIRQIDEYTIENEPVSSAGLMERAALELFRWIENESLKQRRILVFSGPGNNGGDGLALARMLYSARYDVETYYVHFTDNCSADWETNKQRLENETSLTLKKISDVSQFPVVYDNDIIVDAIFGSGLSRQAEGLPSEIIERINGCGATIISIDIPSGLFGEDNSSNSGRGVVQADFTLSFQFPKLAFMFGENERFVGEWSVLPIGLSVEKILNTSSSFYYVETGDIRPLLKDRSRFDHKGNFGHAFIVSGSYGKMGSAVLAAEAAMRTGAGLLTCHIPGCGYSIMQGSFPEAMVITDKCDKYITEIGSTGNFSAAGAGPGIGTDKITQEAFHKFLLECRKPCVIDADALNILSMNREWLTLLQPLTILTPHPKEFERLAGRSEDGYSRLMRQIRFAGEYNCIVVLKGANTSVAFPDGRVWFNSTGNPGMATGGSGDVLTGIILSLLSQGYSPQDAAVSGVFIHGLAGDIAAGKSCFETVIASDIINNIGNAFTNIRNQ